MVPLVSCDYLMHYGVLGQKWGVRRYQNKDGTLTSAGKLHDREINLQNGVTKTSTGASIKVPKVNASDSTTASNKKFTLTKNQKRALAIAGTVTAAAVVSTVAKRYGQDYVDQVIKAGTTVQSLSMDPERLEKGQEFYAAFKDSDKKSYIGLFGQQNSLRGGDLKFANVAEAAKDIKVASNKSAERVFGDLVKNNDDFKSAVKSSLENSKYISTSTELKNTVLTKLNKNYVSKESQSSLMRKAVRALEKGDMSTAYSTFNRAAAVSDDASSRKALDMFYDALKKEGYSGVNDINDQRYSGFNTNSPTIFFDRSGFKTNDIGGITMSSTKLNRSEVEIQKVKELARIPLSTVVGAGPLVAVGGLVVAQMMDVKDGQKEKSNKK